MVSCVSRRYMRVVNGIVHLVVCLSEYLPLCSVCILVIKVQGFVLRRDHKSLWLFFKIMSFRRLPVVREVSGIATMKSIDMYILHDSSLVVSF